MARGQTTQRVGFSQVVESCRQPRDDELSVMQHFARHAGRCDVCVDPYAAYRRDIPLCDKGHALAMDVANYIYGKGGKPFSVIDKKREGESVRLEVPAGCEVINNLCKAFCKGMTLKTREKREKPIIVVPKHDKVEVEAVERSPRVVYSPSQRDQEKASRKKEYVVEDRPRETTRYRDVNMVEITPGSSRRDRKEKAYYNDKSERRDRPKSVIYPDRKGSLYERDEEEKRRRKVYEDQPIVIVAEPSRRYVRR